jgi:radical SAM superfamily enzyme YgiQ (UPF0313 family)
VVAAIIEGVDAGKLAGTITAGKAPDITKSPVPRYDLLDIEAYVAMSIQVVRGCPHDCEFCDVTARFGKVPRYKTDEQVKAELAAILATGFRGSVFVSDDNFIGKRKEAARVVAAIEAWQYARQSPFRFLTQADIGLAEEDELFSSMVNAGFYAVFIGFESPSAEALEGAGKTQNVNVNAPAACAKLRRAGIDPYGGFILGFDADNVESFERMFKFVSDCHLPVAMVGMLTAFPGTALWQRASREGRLISGSTGGDQFVISNVRPVGMSHRELVQGYRRLIKALYEPAEYFRRAESCIDELRPKRKWAVGLRDIYAVMRSIVMQGAFSKYAGIYRRFILKAFAEGKVGRAFILAIYFYHIRKYIRRVVLPRLDNELA